MLDRVFMSLEWELRSPLASLRAITRIGSDHVPLLLSTMDDRPRPPPRFRFENFWLTRPCFVAVVHERWSVARTKPHHVMSAVDTWHICAKRSRQFMKGWGANIGRDLRERKASLLVDIQVLDLRADSSGLALDQWMHRYALEEELMGIYTGEECYWRQRGTQR